MPMRHHLITNGNITLLIEHGNDEIKKVYFRFHGTYEFIPVPSVITIRPPSLLKFTQFNFGILHFQIYHEFDTIILIRFKYSLSEQFFHVKQFSTYEIDDDDTISQTGS